MSRYKRFTLIELLVVVAIIAILAAMLLPALGKAKQRATLVVCLGQTKQFGMATTMYLENNNNQMPRGAEGVDYAAGMGGRARGVPFILVAEYVGAKPVYDGLDGDLSSTLRNECYNSSDIFRCPAKPYDPNALLDYGVNAFHFSKGGGEGGYTGGSFPHEYKWPTRLITDLGKTILYGENNSLEGSSFSYNNKPQFFSNNHLPWKSGNINTNLVNARMMTYFDPTHGGKMAFTAFDGSSHTISLTNAAEWPANDARMNGRW